MSSPTDASFNPFERFAMVSTATSAGFVAAPAAQLKNSHGATSTALAIGAGRTGSTAIRRHSSKGCSAAGSSEGHQGLVEKYKSPEEPEWPLRLIIVGHNPSDTAWQQGHYYANPSNRMYKLLATAKIIPVGFTASDDDRCPITCGVGFTDVGFSIPGTVSSEFKKTDLHTWREGFFKRLKAHAERAAATAALSERGKEEGAEPAESAACGYPKIVAFAGKRQWEELFYDASTTAKAQTRGGKNGTFRFGLQPAMLRPPGWPFPSERTEVFVVPSSSGAAAMTTAARTEPYIELGRRLQEMDAWDRTSSTAAVS
ncbi:unnamed protein product [Sphacelaria rigidula]